MKRQILILNALLFAAGCSTTPAEKKADFSKANKLVENARADLIAGKADSASNKIAAAQHLYSENDSAEASAVLNGFVHQLEEAKQPVHVTMTLAKLSDAGLKALKKGDKIVYYEDPSVNTYFLAQLKSRVDEWPKLHRNFQQQQIQEKKDAAATTQAKKIIQAALRKSYAKELRNNFLDRGLDIEVSVSGKNSNKLKLQFALFSAVWSRKFQKEGLIGQWQEMGFTRIDISDGYDYNVYYQQ